MRVGALIFLMMACSAAPRPPPATPIAVLPPPVDPAPVKKGPECVVDRDCKIEKPKNAVAVCENNKCEAWGVDKAKPWAFERFPELAKIVQPPTASEVSWIDRKKPNTLYLDEAVIWPHKGKKCFAVRLDWSEQGLHGVVTAEYGALPYKKDPTTYDLDLAAQVILSGPGGHTTNAKGEVTSAWGLGEANQLGHSLALDTDRGLLYRAARVHISVHCGDATNLQADPRCKACWQCGPYKIARVSAEPNIGFLSFSPSVQKKKATPEGAPSCIQCTNDLAYDTVDRFSIVTDDVISVTEPTYDGPGFFRKAADCEADRKARAAKN
jgi:hypothetical protein